MTDKKMMPDEVSDIVSEYINRIPTEEQWNLIVDFMEKAHSIGITIDEMIFVTHALFDASVQVLVDEMEYFMREEYKRWLDEGGVRRDIPDDPTESLTGSMMALTRACLCREKESPFNRKDSV